jgi:hypothetical protein
MAAGPIHEQETLALVIAAPSFCFAEGLGCANNPTQSCVKRDGLNGECVECVTSKPARGFYRLGRVGSRLAALFCYPQTTRPSFALGSAPTIRPTRLLCARMESTRAQQRVTLRPSALIHYPSRAPVGPLARVETKRRGPSFAWVLGGWQG